MALSAVFFILGLNGSETAVASGQSAFLREDGSYILREDGSRILRE